MRPLALDLFCKAGGASMGLHQAGFDVIGCDIERQPHYPFTFVQADALAHPFDLSRFAFVWASPVCKRYSRIWRGQEHRRDDYPDQIEPVRQVLLTSGRPFAIENVIGAPMRCDVLLTGAQFGLPIVRDRQFEIHGFRAPFGLHPQHFRETTKNGGLAMVAGGGGAMKGWNIENWYKPEVRARLSARNSVRGWREAMGIEWMTRGELAQAIPPAYAKFIGEAAIAQIATA